MANEPRSNVISICTEFVPEWVMSVVVHYLAGGVLAILSQAALSDTVGFPSALGISGVTSAATPVSLQQVNRTNKGDRLISTFERAPNAGPGSEFVAREVGSRQIRKPASQIIKPMQSKLPEGCNSAVSPLSDRIAANQASNCVTALEMPWKAA